jgi:hypothetical protein
MRWRHTNPIYDSQTDTVPGGAIFRNAMAIEDGLLREIPALPLRERVAGSYATKGSSPPNPSAACLSNFGDAMLMVTAVNASPRTSTLVLCCAAFQALS